MRDRSNRTTRLYAAIPNAAMRDSTISLEARGMLALLMTYSDDWTFQKDHLMNVTGVGRDKFERVMKELRDGGYVDLIPERDEKGQLSGRTWIIRDDPDRSPEKPGFGVTEALKNRGTVKPGDGFAPPLKKINLKENQQEELFGSNEPQNTHAKTEKPAKAEKTSDAFNRFWAVYPKKAAKPEAMRAFDKQVKDGADPDEIIAGAKRYADFLAGGSKGEFRPIPKYPQGWLNGQRWLDEDIAPKAIAPRPRGPQWGEIVR